MSTLGEFIATRKVNWISDADVEGFFGNVSHQHLEELLRKRISDQKLLRLIVRFLKAGVMIECQLQATEGGVPQGASLSPLLANGYLHNVLDEWFEHEVKPRLSGEAYIIRFADNFVSCFELESDAMRYQSVLPKKTWSLLVVSHRGENQVDSVWPLRTSRSPATWQRRTEHVRLPRIHSLRWPVASWKVQAEEENVR